MPRAFATSSAVPCATRTNLPAGNTCVPADPSAGAFVDRKLRFIANMTKPMGREGVECKFYFCPRGIGGSADPDGAGEVGAPVVPCPSVGGNLAASLTMAAARSLLVLHAGSE